MLDAANGLVRLVVFSDLLLPGSLKGLQQERREEVKFNIRSLAALAMLCLVGVFIGCGSGGGGSEGGSNVGSGGTGALALSLTDAPNVEYEAVYVTIDRVEVHLGGNEANPNNWRTITPPEPEVNGFVKKTYNLLELTNGVLEELGMTELPAGLYTQMRLIIGTDPDEGFNIFDDPHEYANYIILKGTMDQTPLKVPSGTQTGIKLVKNFWVGKNQLTELILDFDAAKSVIRAGNSGQYLLKPTIRVLGTEVLACFIEGTVLDDQDNPLEGVSVSAQRSYPLAEDPKDAVVVEATSTTAVDGYFRLLVEPGIYNVVAYKDRYGFDFRCGVNAVVDAESGVTTELKLLNLETDPLGYGYVGGDVTMAGGGDVTISFRAPGCGGDIEVKSITVNVGDEAAHYEVILPVSDGVYYQVVASSEGKFTEVAPEITVNSGYTTILNLDITE